VVTLDSSMSNILITPAAANKPEELQTGVGTGPYIVASADSGTGTYKLTPNPNYWGPDKAKASEVNVSYNEDESSRVIAIETGQIDVLDTITPDSAAYLKTKEGIDIIETPGTRLIHLFYNFRLPADHPLSKPAVREALSYAVDSRTLIDTLMSGQVSNAEGVVPKTLAGFVKTGDYTFDPEKAKSMLAAEGVSGLNLIAIWEESEFAGAAQVMEALVTMLGDVGVTLELKQIPKGGEIAAWRSGEKSGDWHILGNGYGNQTGLALTNLVGQYGGTAEKEAKKESYHGFVFPEITDLITKAGAEADEAKRNDYLKQAQEKIWAQWPAMWAWTPNNVLAKRSTVGGLNLRAINSYDLSAVTVSA
jgi:peptide/nickel transport system substrate-binding protein